MPYNPGVVDRSGELFAGGMERGVASLMEGFQKQQERQKNLIQTAKHVDGIVKMNPELLEGLGMTPEQFNMLGAQEKIGLGMGAVAGAVQKMQMQAERSKLGYYDARQQELKGEQGERAERARRLQDFLQREQMAQMNMPTGVLRPEARREITLENLKGAGVFPEDAERVLKMEGKQINPQLLDVGVPGLKMNPNTGATVELPKPERNYGPDDFVTDPKLPGMVINKKNGALQAMPNREDGAVESVYPWLLTEDEDEFRKGLATVQDPAELKRVVATRTAINRMTGKDDPLKEALAALLSGKATEAGKGEKGAPSAKVRKWVPGKGIQ